MVSCKTQAEIELMRKAGQVVAGTIETLRQYAKPGITSGELDAIAGDYIRSHDCTPAFLGMYDFPKNICICFNEEVVHGVPGKRVLKEGDIITFDVGATYKGWNADGAATFPVGKVPASTHKLLEIAQTARQKGIEQAKVGNYLYDIAGAVHDYVQQMGFGVVADYCGHGIGRKVHEEPDVPNVRQSFRGMRLRKGMCLAIEPLITAGSALVYVKPDKWTVTTKDGKLSAQFEHTIAITDGEPEILTALA